MSSWNPFSYPPKAVLKTIYGFFLPGVVAMGASYARAAGDSTQPVTKFDWVAAVVAMFVTGGAVFAATNTPPGDVTPEEAEGGFVGLWAAVGFALIVIGVLGLLHVLALSLPISVILCVIGVLLVVVGGGYVRRG